MTPLTPNQQARLRLEKKIIDVMKEEFPAGPCFETVDALLTLAAVHMAITDDPEKTKKELIGMFEAKLAISIELVQKTDT